MNDCSSGLTQKNLTDSYTFQHRRRLTDALRTALLFVVVLLFAIPAAGQTSVFQFTGVATGEIEASGGGLTPFVSKLVRIQLSGPSTNVGLIGSRTGEILFARRHGICCYYSGRNHLSNRYCCR